MDMCSSHHETIVYDSYDCPLCEKIKELESYERDIDKLNDEISELKDKIEELNNQE
jgi:predicted RNase H-like nuclease (RuvC/YqgF family)